MSNYIKMPRYATCSCGRQNKIKLEGKKRVPPELDAIGFSRCPDCKTQSVHFAGPELIVQSFVAKFMAYEAEQGHEAPISTSSEYL